MIKKKTVFLLGVSFKEPAFTLKHLLKLLVNLMQVILEWLKNKSDEHFQLIIVDAITVLVNLITDSTVDHVSETANKILEMTMGASDGGLQEILHSHLLSLCFYVIDEEINRDGRFVAHTCDL